MEQLLWRAGAGGEDTRGDQGQKVCKAGLGFPVAGGAQEWAELKIGMWEGGAMVEVWQGQGRRGESLEVSGPSRLGGGTPAGSGRKPSALILHLLLAIHYGLAQDSVTKQTG